MGEIHNEHAAQPRGVCKDPAIERAAQNVKTKLLGILREFILTNVQRNMVALKSAEREVIERVFSWARQYLQADPQ